MPDPNGKTLWQRIAKRIRVPMGFAFAAVYLGFAHPSPLAVALSLLLVVPGVWLRAYASGYVKKNQELATTGPYAHTRNPLYLGSILIAFGFAAASASWIILILLSVLFAVIYIPTIRGEEAFLHAHFPAFVAYSRAVPRLLPRLTPAPTTAAAGVFSKALYLQHREYNALIGSIALYLALILRLWFARLHPLTLPSAF
jgi:protein-S-isoprenylcysteine O-methyltransferase Ste14